MINGITMYWIFSFCLISILGMVVFYSYRYGITPTPTSKRVQTRLISMLPNMMHKEIVELGSGWGNLAFALARHYPTCRVIGYEISPIPYFVSKIFCYFFNFSNLSIKRQDFFDVSLQNTSLVVCYLYPKAMDRLKAKFESELAPDAYIISHTFAIPGWIPIHFERASDLYHTPIYLYRIKKG